jgi:hypothetical protein
MDADIKKITDNVLKNLPENPTFKDVEKFIWNTYNEFEDFVAVTDKVMNEIVYRAWKGGAK